MAAPIRPAGAKAYLREKVVFVPTGTYNPDTPSLAILNAASALDVTKMLFDSSARPTSSTNMARSPKRVGDAASYEFVGESSATFGEIRYSFNPQGAALSDGRKAYEKFPEGTTGFLVYRHGIDRDTDLAVGNNVWSYPVEFGKRTIVPEGEGEGAEWAIVQPVAQTGPEAQDKAVIA